VEDRFSHEPGVIRTTVGYEGGNTENPTYHAVCGGKTGHAETVEVVYDPSKVKYSKLIDIFWSLHNPHSAGLNRPGSQYRSILFFTNAGQQAVARTALASEQKQAGTKVYTEVLPAAKFWRAEEYHQKYMQKNGSSSCF
jgi:peptide-methionine (S)-S-oxide reductase